VTNSNTQAENLLELELDGGTDLVGLGGQVISVRDGSGELADLVETGTQETGDHLDKSIRSKESIVLLGELLDQLLVLVQLLQVLNRLELHASSLSLVTVESITENADGKVGTGNVGELDGTRETLVTLGIVVLQTNLELDGLSETTLLLLGGGLNGLNDLSDGSSADFAIIIEKMSKSVF
jgi:hypothetical protein